MKKRDVVRILNWIDDVAAPYIHAAFAVYTAVKGDYKISLAFCFLIILFFINRKLKMQ